MHFVTNNTKPECEMGWYLIFLHHSIKSLALSDIPQLPLTGNIFLKTLEDKISIYFKGKKLIFVDFTVYLHDLYKQIS